MRILTNKYTALLWLMRNERRPRKQILDFQTRKLQSLVRCSYENVPFYRALYDSAGVVPDDIRTIADLRLLPTVSKHDFHTQELSYYLDQRIIDTASLIPIKTSGSSGLSLEFFVDRAYDQLRKAQFLRPYLTNGQRLTDGVLRFSNQSSGPMKWFQKLGILREHLIYSDSNPEDQIKVIRAAHPEVIQGYGSELSLLAQAILDQAIVIPKPRIVFTDSELLTPGSRKLIEKAFCADVIDVYGTFETDNTGYECAEHAGYHLAEDCVITEFLDQEGEPVNPGQRGELVFTVLHNHTMPFIRYKIGDMGSYNSEICPCGRTSIRMTQVFGRMADFAISNDGKLKSPRAFDGVFAALADRVREYQIVQKDIDLFEVKVVPKHELSLSLEQSMKSALIAEFPGATVRVKAVSGIHRSVSGKYKSFVQSSGRRRCKPLRNEWFSDY